MRRDAQRLKDELKALQRMRRLNEQAEELDRAATREVATTVEEREARAARRDERRRVAEARATRAADF
jgi:hypothetical protein